MVLRSWFVWKHTHIKQVFSLTLSLVNDKSKFYVCINIDKMFTRGVHMCTKIYIRTYTCIDRHKQICMRKLTRMDNWIYATHVGTNLRLSFDLIRSLNGINVKRHFLLRAVGEQTTFLLFAMIFLLLLSLSSIIFY